MRPIIAFSESTYFLYTINFLKLSNIDQLFSFALIFNYVQEEKNILIIIFLAIYSNHIIILQKIHHNNYIPYYLYLPIYYYVQFALTIIQIQIFDKRKTIVHFFYFEDDSF